MKYVILIAVLMLSACSDQSSPHPAAEEVRAEFVYVLERPGMDNWQTWQVTQAIGGDCEDYAIWVRSEMIKTGVSPEEIEFIRGKLRGISHIAIRYRGYFIDNYGTWKYYPEFKIDGAYSSKFIDLRLASTGPG